MKKIKYIILLIISFLPFVVNADQIYKVDMKVNIDQNGTGTFIENWDVKADGGTEWYKKYSNLKSMELYDFEVLMDDIKLTKKDNWNINASMTEKSGYYGIHYIEDGIELCFGKGDFGNHRFTLKYKISNMIFNTSDSQFLYFNLIPKSTVDNYNIVIDSFYSFEDTLDVWGYGAKGYAYVQNGKIMLSNEGNMENNYVVVLAKFPTGTFNTNNKDSEFKTFDDVLKRAEEDTFDYDYGENENFLSKLFNIILPFIPFIITGICIYFSSVSNYGFKDNKKITKGETPFFREIPCNKDIYYANTLIKLNNFSYKETNILGAIILKWVKEDRIKFIKDETGIFNKETAKIDLRKEFIEDAYTNPNEKKLFTAMYEASEDGLLETSEFEKWGKKNYSKFFTILETFTLNEISKLKKNGHIYKRNNRKECKYNNVMDDTLYEDSKQLYGLKLFLEEFSKIDTKEVIEVKLWDEYLMFAYLFGMADMVTKQLKNLYPEFMSSLQESTTGIDYDTLVFIDSISSRGVSAATSARSAAESYSSGGGGFSSGGGGGGSFGGGGNMGGR